ncbi:aspartate dehydrogenase domain-containing protein [Rhodococcus erythropolis]|uniref:aspartate dehydrogenase domain-containing protein n=1 Tax=Rhodococcus erythropolis TaxID=1833 RepID=UPI00294A2FBC|nr:aspartate dehydrogenase domain-containing protein [Rhodococcus erythropolis]MDV6275110.1 aspartate dehydrogenase domain-containing protein [Rhodococcus erythropolis]
MNSHTRVSVIGYGSIGRIVADRLFAGALPGVEIVGIVDNGRVPNAPVPQVDLHKALEISDVLVECAGQAAVFDHAETILGAGRDLVVSSAGALSNPDFVSRLRAHPGRMLCTTGAVGGLDLLGAASDAAPFDSVTVQTTKLPGSLVQHWMSEEQSAEILVAESALTVFEGGAVEAARLFPRSLNVATAVAFAVSDRDLVQVKLIADPAATLTRHEVTARGPVGNYHFTIENLPSPENPRTSAIVPFAVLRTLGVLLGRHGVIG